MNVSIHAPAWGATMFFVSFTDGKMCFNPRARVGRDLDIAVELLQGIDVSIHAPAWGATFRLIREQHRYIWFQSTRPRGARPVMPVWGALQTMFQSTRPRGARQF